MLTLCCGLAQAQAQSQSQSQSQFQASSAARPQLDEAAAARLTVAAWLRDWQPQRLDPTGWTPDFIVAADGSGTHRSVQAALDALPASASGEARRRYILIKPGVYRETVCVRDKLPFTLYGGGGGGGGGGGSGGDATAVRIVQGHYNGLAKQAGVETANPCVPELAAFSYGTPGSASVAIFSNDVQLLNLSIANDAMEGVRDGVGYPKGAGESGGAQGVALMTRGDRIQLEAVALLGHQDTLMASRAAPDTPARVYVHASRITGDVDFIFGNANLVIDGSSIVSRAGRRTPGHGGHVLAPSTPARHGHGILVTGSRLIGEPGLAPGSISLGRAWDEGVAKGEWQAGVSPNGQALVRDSELGAHLGPWAASTSRRPFGADNRMAEFNNKPLPERDWIREPLAANDGWAAAEGGTRGGADARPAHVREVRNREELVAALALGAVPKIIQIRGRIDLRVDAQGRPLTADDFRDPDYDFEAFLRAFDPATWGQKDPEGPLEQARRRSARRQAAWMQLRVPSNTTLVGLGSDAALAGASLFLDKVDNVIVRNVHFSDAYDFFPAWEPRDNGHGEWNSEYDTLTLRGATHVWVDHCTFDDGQHPDQAERIAFGQRMQHHDGLLDITQQSDFVTVSWNVFRQHDKTMLIGSSDGQKLDEGRLRVTLHHNLWEQVKERTPRVRWGQVHVYNNLFVGRGDVPYAYGYSLGVGLRSRLYSERNVWELTPEIGAGRLVRLLKGEAFFDRGSLLNGRPVDLLAALRAANPGVEIGGDVGWRPSRVGALDEAAQVARRVRAEAGAGRVPALP